MPAHPARPTIRPLSEPAHCARPASRRHSTFASHRAGTACPVPRWRFPPQRHEMNRVAGINAYEQKVLDDIATHGWHCVHVQTRGDRGPYSYTVGLFHTYKHPELFISGLATEVSQLILQR